MPDALQLGIQYCNFFFTIYFVLEMLTKLMGLGPQLYASDNYNLFDAVVTILGGMFDLIVSPMQYPGI